MVVLLVAFTVAALVLRRGGHGTAAAARDPAGDLAARERGVDAGPGRPPGGLVDRQLPVAVPRAGLDQLWGAITGTGERRTFFVRSGLPAWEQWAAFVAPLLVIGLGIVGLRLMRRMKRPALGGVGAGRVRRAVRAVAAAHPHAHRCPGRPPQRPFTYLGVCLVAASGLALVIGRATQSAGRLRVAGPLVIALVIGVVAIGNTASSVHEFDRFPGPWEAGADSRSLTPELLDTSAWLRGYDSDDRVASDIYSGTLSVFGTTRNSSRSPPRAPATCRSGASTTARRSAARTSPCCDRRATVPGGRPPHDHHHAAQLRTGFQPQRGGPSSTTSPSTRRRLSRLESFRWLTKVYAIEQLRRVRDPRPGQPAPTCSRASRAPPPRPPKRRSASAARPGGRRRQGRRRRGRQAAAEQEAAVGHAYLARPSRRTRDHHPAAVASAAAATPAPAPAASRVAPPTEPLPVVPAATEEGLLDRWSDQSCS